MKNLVINPDFSQSHVGDETASGWHARVDGNKFTYRVDEIQDPGMGLVKRIQRVTGDGRGDGYVWQRFALEEKTRYAMSGRVKTEGETTAQLWLFFQDEQGKVLERLKTEYLLGDSDWSTLEVEGTSPPGTREGVLFAISFTVAESASSLWDRVDVVQLDETSKVNDLVVIPKPQSFKIHQDGPFVLSTASRIIVHATTANDRIELVARYLQNAIENRCGLHLTIEAATADSSEYLVNTIQLVVLGAETWEHHTFGSLSSDAVHQAEGYCLNVQSNSTQIVAQDERGLFYGVQSLLQLFGQSSVKPALIPACRIDDWPDISRRGVHILMDFRSVDFVKNLIDQVFARYKYNTLILECSMAKWESHPELWQPEAVEKQQLKEVIAYAQERFIEVIPLIQSLGHCQYLFLNGTHSEICEDPEHPWAYNPLDDRAYNLIFDLMQEAIDLFEPKFLHIGHDEVRMTGTFPNSEEGKRIGFANLFVLDTNRIARFLRERGVRAMMWADVVLETEFADYVSQLDPDIVMVDWQYHPFRNYRGIDVLRRAGFDAIGSTWYGPQNIQTFAKYMKRVNGTGMLQTTWTGHFGSAQAADKELHQYIAHIYAAEAFWNADGYAQVNNVPYSPETLVRKVIDQIKVTTDIPDWGREW